MASWHPSSCWLADPQDSRGWKRRETTLLKSWKLAQATQIQYVVSLPKAPKPGSARHRHRFKIQGINIRDSKKWGRRFRFDSSLHALVSLVTKKQWVLQWYWEQEAKNLPPPLVNLLAGYILYYEKVLDALLPNNVDLMPDVVPLRRWVRAEFLGKGIHTPTVEDFLEEMDVSRIDLEAMIRGDPWGVGHHISRRKITSIGPERRKLILARVDAWLRNHEATLGT